MFKLNINIKRAAPVIIGAGAGFVGAKMLVEKFLDTNATTQKLPAIARQLLPAAVGAVLISSNKPILQAAGAGMAAYSIQAVVAGRLSQAPAVQGLPSLNGDMYADFVPYDEPARGSGVGNVELDENI